LPLPRALFRLERGGEDGGDGIGELLPLDPFERARGGAVIGISREEDELFTSLGVRSPTGSSEGSVAADVYRDDGCDGCCSGREAVDLVDAAADAKGSSGTASIVNAALSSVGSSGVDAPSSCSEESGRSAAATVAPGEEEDSTPGLGDCSSARHVCIGRLRSGSC